MGDLVVMCIHFYLFERQVLKPKKGNLLGHVHDALRASFVALLD